MDQEKKFEKLEMIAEEQDEAETEEEEEVLPEWFDGKHFFDVLFCREYLAEHPMVCVGGELFTKEGRVTDETAVVKEMYDLLKEYLPNGAAKDKLKEFSVVESNTKARTKKYGSPVIITDMFLNQVIHCMQ